MTTLVYINYINSLLIILIIKFNNLNKNKCKTIILNWNIITIILYVICYDDNFFNC